MISRVIQWSAAALLGAVLATAPAGAVSLLPDTLYIMSQTWKQSINGSSGTDTYLFEFDSPTAIGVPVLDSTTNVKVGLKPNQTSFASLTLDWLSPTNTTLISGPLTVPIGILEDVVLPLTPGYGVYKLVLAWTLDVGKTGSYTSFLQTPPNSGGENIVPLPPALILFGSALVGLTVLGRRKRKGATA